MMVMWCLGNGRGNRSSETGGSRLWVRF